MDSNFGAVINAWVASFLVNARNMSHRLVGGALARAPFIGDQLQQFWNEWVETAYQLQAGWIEAALPTLVGTVRRPTDVANALLAAYNRATVATLGQLWKLRYVYIPAAEARAEDYASQLFSWLDGEIRRLIDQAEAYARSLYERGLAYSQQLQAQALDYARQLQQQALDFARAGDQQAEDYARQLQAQALDYTRDLDQQETDYTRRGIQQAEDYARALQEQALGFTRDVEGFARAGVQQAEDYAQALFRDLAGEQVKAERRSETYAFKLVEQIYALPCIQECQSLGALGKDLSGLDLFGLVLAVLEASKHPREGAEGLFTRFEGPMRALSGEVRQLWDRA